MPFFSFKNIKVAGMACAVPTEIVTAKSFEPAFGAAAVESFTKMTGIHQYRKTKPEQTASDLGFAAARHLIEKQNIDISQIGALVFVSHSPDYRRPGTAFVLHKRFLISLFDDELGKNLLQIKYVVLKQLATSWLRWIKPCKQPHNLLKMR